MLQYFSSLVRSPQVAATPVITEVAQDQKQTLAPVQESETQLTSSESSELPSTTDPEHRVLLIESYSDLSAISLSPARTVSPAERVPAPIAMPAPVTAARDPIVPVVTPSSFFVGASCAAPARPAWEIEPRVLRAERTERTERTERAERAVRTKKSKAKKAAARVEPYLSVLDHLANMDSDNARGWHRKLIKERAISGHPVLATQLQDLSSVQSVRLANLPLGTWADLRVGQLTEEDLMYMQKELAKQRAMTKTLRKPPRGRREVLSL